MSKPHVKYRAAVEIVVRRNGKYLAVNNRRWGGFSLPGGKLEPGESFDDAARRELEEETGCKPLSLRRLAGNVVDDLGRDDDGSGWFCISYVADIGDQEPFSNEKGTDPFWISEEQLLVDEGRLYPREWYDWLFRLLRLDALAPKDQDA